MKRKITDSVPYEKTETRRWQDTLGTRKDIEYKSAGPVPTLDHDDPRNGKIIMTKVKPYTGRWDKPTQFKSRDVGAAVFTIPPRSRKFLSVVGEVGTLRIEYEATINIRFQGGTSVNKKVKGVFIGTQIYSEHVVVSSPESLETN